MPTQADFERYEKAATERRIARVARTRGQLEGFLISLLVVLLLGWLRK